jgi:AraC-like DNA-binding protein
LRNTEEALAHRPAHGATLRSNVENAITPLLPHGKASAGEVARQLGMSHRTLARRLAAEQLTFSEIQTELKTDLAKRYLRDGDLPISQIAWLLGYREVSAFTHAFRRWTGTAPRQSRAQGKFVSSGKRARAAGTWRTGPLATLRKPDASLLTRYVCSHTSPDRSSRRLAPVSTRHARSLR